MDDVTPPEMSAIRYRILTKIAHTVYFFIKGMTVGVRAACFDEQGRIFLVRHSYIPGWHMPGGGVERYETVRQAIAKEIREEGNLELLAPPELLHVYYNRRTSKRDHVVFFRCLVRQTHPRLADREIVESGFFALDALPEATTSATRRRLAEISGEKDYDELW
ncbi:NUDIX domain-containing protein [Rhizobium alvei]|uniref:NUDIX domain-containing protein n=1 Tax=Rhizobium alvei TaxID=1132659 RepID=A0ABT8YL03_9HYPH|nr:NUDIX domain-containing protein [Rhizobium alvei]MDO6964259.1 NUDIX domain-containing protein [Rhizobium alvei]